MNDKDHLINTQIIKFQQNWPRLATGQKDLYYRLLHGLDTALIPLLADRLLDTLEYPPKQSDIRRTEQQILCERANERQQAGLRAGQHQPPLSAAERVFQLRLAHNIASTIGRGFAYWLSVHQRIIEECRMLGREELAEGFAAAVDRETKRSAPPGRGGITAEPAAAPESPEAALPEGYVSLTGGRCGIGSVQAGEKEKTE